MKMVIQGKAKDLGDNFQVRRSLPFAKQRLVGPFIFWDHMGSTTISGEHEMLVRAHPHIGLSTITYLFSGEILHRDSLNNELSIRPREVNWLTAGTSIVHSERSRADQGSFELEGIQVWVALPKDSEDVAPSFVHHKENELPLIDFEGFQLRLIAGEALNHKSPLPVYSPLFYLNGKATGSASMNFPIKDNQEGAVYVTRGSITVEGNTYSKFDMVVFNPGENIQFQSEQDCEFMILGGEIFPEGRHIWWNFVSHDKQKIEEAKARWVEDQFDSVINETEKIPLPGQCPIAQKQPFQG